MERVESKPYNGDMVVTGIGDSSVLEQYKGTFGQTGWICPKCGRVYAPYVSMCKYCCGGGDTTPYNIVKLNDNEQKLVPNEPTGDFRDGCEQFWEK